MTRKTGTRELLPQLLTPGLWHLRQYPEDWKLLPHLQALGTHGPCSLQSWGISPRAVGRASYVLCVAPVENENADLQNAVQNENSPCSKLVRIKTATTEHQQEWGLLDSGPCVTALVTVHEVPPPASPQLLVGEPCWSANPHLQNGCISAIALPHLSWDQVQVCENV